MKTARLLILVLLFCITLVAGVHASAYAETVASGTWESLNWTLDDDGLLIISGNGEMAGFYNTTDITSTWRQYKNRIYEIIIENGVTTIGDSAFQDCNNLAKILIPDSITRIGNNAFYYCGQLKSIAIPYSVRSIGKSAFYSCSQLTEINYLGTENEWNTIQIETNNKVLTTATVHYKYIARGKSGSMIWKLDDGGELVIENNGDMPNYQYFWDIPWYNYRDQILNIIVSDTTSSITAYAFLGCSNVESIVLPDSIISIGNSAFQDCSKLTSIFIPNGVETIGISAFTNCSSLKNIDIPDNVSIIAKSTFSNCLSLTSVKVTDIYYSGTQEQWESIRNIRNISLPQATMVHCAPLQTVTVSYDANGGVNAPETQTKAYGEGLKLSETIPIRNGFFFLGWAEGIGAFDPTYLPGDYFTKNTDTILYAVWAQPDFLMPDALAIIEEEAFANCAFRFVALSEKTTQLQNAAFANCYKLKYIYIPDACVSINKDAFNGISNLTILCEPGSYAEYFASHWGFASLPVR